MRGGRGGTAGGGRKRNRCSCCCPRPNTTASSASGTCRRSGGPERAARRLRRFQPVAGSCENSRLDAPVAQLDRASPSRSEERRVGKECVSTCRSRGHPYHNKKKTTLDRKRD